MEYLIKGIKSYQENKFKERKELLDGLAEGQGPASLIITCSDSRILVNEFTDTKPGEVFVIRNAGNMIESYDSEEASSEALTLEYGVKALGVKEVIICGHVKCGAMNGLKNLDSLNELPLVQKGLLKLSKEFGQDRLDSLSVDELIAENVKHQMLNVYSYPFVREKIEKNEIQIWGWVYDFIHGKLKAKISLSNALEE